MDLSEFWSTQHHEWTILTALAVTGLTTLYIAYRRTRVAREQAVHFSLPLPQACAHAEGGQAQFKASIKVQRLLADNTVIFPFLPALNLSFGFACFLS